MTYLIGRCNYLHFFYCSLKLTLFLKLFYMKVSIITFFSCLLLSYSTKAQEAQKNNKNESMGCGAFSIGYGYMDVSKLQVFVPDDISKFGSDHLVIGGTGHAIINRFVIGGSGFGITGDGVKTDSLIVNVSGGVGTFDLGYLILNKNKIKIYPLLGIGGSGFGLQISKNRNYSVNQIKNDPGQEINISHGGFIADISININIIPNLNYDEKKNSYGGFMTGFKIGYLYSIPSSDWKFSGGNITNGPDFGLSMFYVKLLIGGFGSQKNKNGDISKK